MPSYTLTQLASAVRNCLESGFPGRYWVSAETSGVRVGISGHCYLELLDKDTSGSQVTARMKAMIWASDYATLSGRFQRETGETFDSGLHVLVLVSVSYHEQYGLSLRILDIDPSYTMGAMARKRKEIIEELRRQGLFDLNRSLSLPRPTQRIAIVSSGAAAGFEDFIAHLSHSAEHFCFYPVLFQAVMQGAQTEASVLGALECIAYHRDSFDVVVIIRGGGAVSELAAFDSLAIGQACARFPLPILTGIGHDRDETVVDLVAYRSLKTPTAVADFLVNCQREEWKLIDDLRSRAAEGLRMMMMYCHERLIQLSLRTPAILKSSVREEHHRIKSVEDRIRLAAKQRIAFGLQQLQIASRSLPALMKSELKQNTGRLDQVAARLPLLVTANLKNYNRRLETNEQAIRLLHPNATLRRGFAIVLKDGKAIRSHSELHKGDRLVAQFADGSVSAVVDQPQKGKR